MSATTLGGWAKAGTSLLALALVCGGGTLTAATAQTSTANSVLEGSSEFVVDVTPENHAAIVASSSKRPVIVMFSTAGCQPCGWLKPKMKAKAETEKSFTLALLDGVKYQDLWSVYNRPWFPSLIALRDGKEVARDVGYDNNFAATEAWVNTFLKGEVPISGPIVTDLNTSTEDAVKKVSFKHPVIALFNAEGPKYQAYDAALRKQAAADAGKWTLAVATGTKAEQKAMQKKYGVESRPGLVVIYRGKTYQKFLGLHKEAKWQEFVKQSYLTHYEDLPEPGDNTPTDLIKHVTVANHDEIVASSSKRPVLLDLGGEGCLDCMDLTPFLTKKVQAEKSWTLGILEVDAANEVLWEKYGKPMLPTVIAIRDGKEVARITGFMQKEKRMNDWIDTFVKGGVPTDPGLDPEIP